jgi:pyridoxine 5-phosphate synthase
MNIDAVEIHTGDYAKDFLEENDISLYIEQFKKGKVLIENGGLGYHAGHGLTDESLVPLVKEKLFAEYNIGHWIICDSLFCGLDKSIKKLVNIIENN